MNIAIIDFDQKYSKLLLQKLKDVFTTDCFQLFSTGEHFLECSKFFDLIILDVYLSGVDGIEIAKKMEKNNSYILFLSSSKDRMIEAFGEKILGYLLKSDGIEFNLMKLIENIDKIKHKSIILVKSTSGLISIDVNKIIKCSLEARKLFIYLREKQIQVYDMSLSELFAKVESNFIYANRSCIVNCNKILFINKNELTLEMNIKETIGRPKLKLFKHEYLKKVIKI